MITKKDEMLSAEIENTAVVVDNRGMLCAQGILRLMRTMVTVAPESVIKVLSTDLAAEHDYPAWCQATGHKFLGHRRDPDDRWGFLVVSFVQKRPEDTIS
jgi:TusA-related sulfurtransferase